MKELNRSDNQMIQLLQEYIRINTSGENAQYGKAVDFLAKQALKDGFDCTVITLKSGYPALIITYRGSRQDLPALVLNHHMDVVPAVNIDQWVVPPFSGEIVDFAVVGRGAQDMKGVGIVHYSALQELKQQGFCPERTIHLFAVPDEERGGFSGTALLLETEQFNNLNIGFVLDEGHSSGNSSFLYLVVGERKPLQITLKSQGFLVHGSRLRTHNALHELIVALHELVSFQKKQQDLAHKDTLDGMLLSINVTSLQAGVYHGQQSVALNIIPESATATLDIRVPPSIPLFQVKTMIEEMVQRYPSLSYSVEATVNDYIMPENYKSELYLALEKICSNNNIQTRMWVSEGASDLRFYKERGIDGIGFTPFTGQENIHGTNESVLIQDMVQGKKIMISLIKEICENVKVDV